MNKLIFGLFLNLFASSLVCPSSSHAEIEILDRNNAEAFGVPKALYRATVDEFPLGEMYLDKDLRIIWGLNYGDVKWDKAENFCREQGARLPTIEELKAFANGIREMQAKVDIAIRMNNWVWSSSAIYYEGGQARAYPKHSRIVRIYKVLTDEIYSSDPYSNSHDFRCVFDIRSNAML